MRGSIPSASFGRTAHGISAQLLRRRCDESLKDLASLGGWKDTQTLLKCYLKEDETQMVEALRSRRTLHARRPAEEG